MLTVMISALHCPSDVNLGENQTFGSGVSPRSSLCTFPRAVAPGRPLPRPHGPRTLGREPHSPPLRTASGAAQEPGTPAGRDRCQDHLTPRLCSGGLFPWWQKYVFRSPPIQRQTFLTKPGRCTVWAPKRVMCQVPACVRSLSPAEFL